MPYVEEVNSRQQLFVQSGSYNELHGSLSASKNELNDPSLLEAVKKKKRMMQQFQDHDGQGGALPPMPPPIDDDRARYNRSMVGGLSRHSVEYNTELKNQLLQTIKNRENFPL